MPRLLDAIRAYDLALLHAIAECWNVPLAAPTPEAARLALTAHLLDRDLLAEAVPSLPRPARLALADLLAAAGRLPLPQFTRRHGEIRPMGAGRLAREKPHLQPATAAEMLHYRGLLTRAFFDTPGGPQEFAYIPEDLLPLLPALTPRPEKPLGRPAAADECARLLPASPSLLDDAATLLAALRIGHPLPADLPAYGVRAHVPFLHALLASHGLLTPAGAPRPQPVRAFLELPRAAALAALAQTWLNAADLDEIRLLPGITAEGDWRSDPLRTRRQILDLLAAVPPAWWSLPAFMAAVKQNAPDFQRPDGNYDTWYLKNSDGVYLRGFQHWDDVEGALLKWVITGPLHWLGFLDLAASRTDAFPEAFRASAWAASLRDGLAPEGIAPEGARLHVRSSGQISVPRGAPRAVRYLLARMCAWDVPSAGEYRYHPTPASLKLAADQGLTVDHLIDLLARYSEGIPPNVTAALKNWQKHGQAARVYSAPILQLPTAEALQELRASRAARFLGETLGPAAIALKPGAQAQVLAILVELGYLGEIL
jgi:hypothetical protein